MSVTTTVSAKFPRSQEWVRALKSLESLKFSLKQQRLTIVSVVFPTIQMVQWRPGHLRWYAMDDSHISAFDMNWRGDWIKSDREEPYHFCLDHSTFFEAIHPHFVRSVNDVDHQIELIFCSMPHQLIIRSAGVDDSCVPISDRGVDFHNWEMPSVNLLIELHFDLNEFRKACLQICQSSPADRMKMTLVQNAQNHSPYSLILQPLGRDALEVIIVLSSRDLEPCHLSLSHQLDHLDLNSSVDSCDSVLKTMICSPSRLVALLSPKVQFFTRHIVICFVKEEFPVFLKIQVPEEQMDLHLLLTPLFDEGLDD